MPKRILTKVSAKADDDCYGPDYALIELIDDGLPVLMGKVAATEELAARFAGDATTPRTGALYATEWWLHDLPLGVTWLRYDAVTLDDGQEPSWLAGLDSVCYAEPPEGWMPRLGEETDHGHQYGYAGVDCETVKAFADGRLRIEANLKDSASEFATYEFPASVLNDTPCDPQEVTPCPAPSST